MDVIELEESMEVRNSKVVVIGEGKITPFRIDIKEVIHGLGFSELPIPELKIIDNYMDELKPEYILKPSNTLATINLVTTKLGGR